MPQKPHKIDQLSAEQLDENLDQLAILLHANVLAGASVSFVMPFDLPQSSRFWQHKIRPLVAAGDTLLLVATLNGRIVGSVQLECDMPPNQPHRAAIAKLLVHPDYRRKGIARALMVAAEQAAKQKNRNLLTLDTASDEAMALYKQLGYVQVGIIPGYALTAQATQLEATTIMYKTL
ncbi:MAG: GNAT family N-acetyltransferase [Rhizobiales bacterium]|nr:GNAT family N-acetyltransferase [Hyphomicrobiales bacterium]NRB15287.1 GNAT family N-acetyltransferase [Hyphomicrobiales bacterium]